MRFQYSDGGRSAAGFKGEARDCVTRAIAIAAEIPYEHAYLIVSKHCGWKRGKRTNGSPRNGVPNPTTRKIMASLGWKWTPTMHIGSGCKVHLREDELPKGRIIVKLSGHIAAVIDGIVHDNHDCTREGTRCVYGYWSKA